MAEGGVISNRIVIDTTQAIAAFQTLRKEMQELKLAHEKALRSDDKTTIFKGATQDVKALQQEIARVSSEIGKLRNAENSKVAKDNISAPYVNLQAQIRKAAAEAERLWVIQSKDRGVGNVNVTAYNDARTSLSALVATQEKYNTSLGKSTGLLEGYGRRVRSHIEWITSGLLIGATFAIPLEYIQSIKEIEVKMAGMSQVLPSLHGDQGKLNEVSREFVGIAQQYGESVKGVIEAGMLWGRAYKDIPTLMAFTSASAKLAVADNFSLAESNKALEATLAQYQWRATSAAEATAYSMRVVDTWTAVAHNAQVSAQDLAHANERTAGVARMVGVEFEFLQAAIAAGVKNTGRSGAEIGNTLKSVFGSIHSEKAVKEIEAIGVAMKTTSADGTQTWRKVQDVMVDLAIATRATTKDVEGLFKAAAGGKFQWAKFSSMLDYDELIKVYGIAVNSAGMTEKQIAMQMDTIARKAEQLKATLTGLATNSGGELARAIKEGIGGITNFLNVLNNVSRGTYETAAVMAKAVIVVYSLAKAWQSIGIVSGIYNAAMLSGAASTGINTASQGLNTGAQISNAMAQGTKTVATGVNTISTNVNTAAQTRNAVVTTIATGGLNLLIPVLIGSALAFDAYSMATGGAATSMDKLGKSTDALSKMEEDMGTKENLIQSLKQRYDYVDTLTNAHAKLTAAVANESVGSAEYNKLQKSLGNTQEELAKICGVTTEEIVQDGVLRIDLINQEKDNMETKAGNIRKEIIELKNAQVEFTKQAIQSAQDRIDALGSETAAWGYLAQAQMWAMEQYAGIMDAQIKAKTMYANAIPDSFGNEKAKAYADVANDTAYRESLRNYRPQSVTDEINANREKIAGLRVKQAQIAGSNIDYSTVNQGSEVNPGDPKKVHDKSSGAMPPDDPNKVIARDAYKDAVTLATHRAKLATDEYTASLDTLNTTEEMYGKTADSTVNKLTLMQKRWQALNDQEWESKTNADTLESQLDTMIGDTGALGISKTDYDAMTKVKRAELKVQYRDVLDAHKDLKAVTAAYYAWEEKASKEHLEKTKLGNDIAKASRGYKPEELEARSLQRNRTTEEILIAQNTNKFDGNNARTLDAIHYKARLEDAKVYNIALLRLKAELNANEETLRTQATDGTRDELQKMVDASQDAYDKMLQTATNNANSIKDLEYSKNAKIKEGMAGIVDDVIVKGGSLKEIWGNLWNALASSAIKALFQVQSTGGGLLESIFGLLGGGLGGGGKSPTTRGGTAGLDASILGVIPSFFANGGLTDKPSIFGEDGIEMAIPMKPQKRERALELYAQTGQMLGVGTQVVPNISPRTTEIAQNASLSNKEVVERLDRTNALLESLANITLNKEVSGGQSGIVQPIVFPTSQGDDQLFAQIQGMRRKGMKV